jgi:RHS repeat-associated protein
LDLQHSGDTLDTVLFVDGLGRVIQTKKDLEQDAAGDGNAVVGMSVSGQVQFDGRGRIAAQGQPTFDTGDSTTFVVGTPSNPTRFTYDSLGRTIKVERPDANASGGMAVTTTTYGITTSGVTDGALEPLPLGLTNSGRWLTTIQTDPLGNKQVTYDDANGRRVAVKQYNVIGAETKTLTALVTEYQHDPMGQLLTVTDAKNNTTTSTYDTLGRMVQLVSPDAGTTEYRYDLAGNLGAKITGKLAASNQQIKYVYDYNRLKQVTYPNMAAVTYTYGTADEAGDSKGNLAGRVKTVTMEGGSEKRYYDRLGNVNKTETTLIHPKETSLAPVVFTMKFNYDSFGRMQDMTYPNWVKNDWTIMSGEGEKVTYSYDRGGLLDKITGRHQTPNPEQTSHPVDFTYLNHIGYDEFEQRTVLKSGNGIVNKYGYEAKTRRLSSLDAASLGYQEREMGKPATYFHKLRYTYDVVGNITHVENQSTVYTWQNASVHTGPMKMDYAYDNLYQLKSATGMYRPHPGFGYQYASAFQYDEIGNMTKKSQLENRIVWDDQNPPEGMAALQGWRFDHTVSAFSHTLDYKYTGSRPHAASTIVETPAGSSSGKDRAFSYDGAGNNTGNTFDGETRVQVWDDENRLKEVQRSSGTLGKFLYNPDGERTHKVASAGETFYLNQFFVLQPNRVPTKHIFAGETRIVSKTDAIWMQTPTITNYHPDYLGSTSYTSGSDQTLLQHERYFPFGERDIGDQEECDQSRADGMRRDWLFNSKEWDWDTGLFYFGARYYDARMVTWQSADPILDQYMRGQGMAGGVFTPSSLAAYTYSRGNPIVLRDPDGRESPVVVMSDMQVQKGVPWEDTTLAQQSQLHAPTVAGVVQAGLAFASLPAAAFAAAFGEGTANAPGPNDVTIPARTTEDIVRDVAPFIMVPVAAEVFGKTGGPLNSQQAANLARFEKKLPAGAGPTSVAKLKSGGATFRAEVPGRVPGSKAIYEKTVGPKGKTEGYVKTTIDPAGKVVHAKQKYP